MREAAGSDSAPHAIVAEAMAAVDRSLASTPMIPALRSALQQASNDAAAAFWEGVSASVLVPARALLVDHVLRGLWVQYFGPDCHLALVAVGGYGRGELHPGSDVDIMVLIADDALDIHRASLERFLTLLWDIGLEIGQSVRTVDDCVRESQADVTVMTNLIEARLLSGDALLLERMKERTGPSEIWSNRAFFEAKKEEQKQRYRRYHETAYNLEPNVKEGSGGLRDLQTIAWVAKRYFDANTLHDLVYHKFLTEPEYHDLLDAQDFLWQVRFGLHALAKRREDRLGFDYQRQLAQRFGYRDQAANLAVEQLMQRYYRTIMQISLLNEMLLQHFEEAILLAGESTDPIPINRRFQIRRGFLEVSGAGVFRRNPFALMELFLHLQQHAEITGVRATTVRLVRDHLHLIDENFREDLRARSLFMEILRQPDRVARSLRRMNRYGVLGAYLPEFAAIVGRMQYDLFHAYTVDQHTLFLVRNLRRFNVARFADESPHCTAVMQRISKPELLYIAALYHDIAKGRGGDHSKLGAEDVRRFSVRHGLSEFDTNLMIWLVEHHLAMSLTAQKKDIHDPDVIAEFARFVCDQLHLDYLYLLTVADIRATNPNLWNTWRAALLRQLYEATRRSLRRGLDNPLDRSSRSRELRTKALLELSRLSIDANRAEEIWDDLNGDYLLRFSLDEITWHTRAILKKADDDRALVLCRQDSSRGGTEIFLYCKDSDGIFALVTAALDRLRLNVLDARILTTRGGFVLHSFTVLESSGEPMADKMRRKEVASLLRRQLNATEQPPLDSGRDVPRVLKHFHTPTSIHFDQDPVNRLTLLEIITADRPGLLSRVGQAFVDCKIQLQNAKIATIGERAEDVFYITDAEHEPLLDPNAQQDLIEAINSRL